MPAELPARLWTESERPWLSCEDMLLVSIEKQSSRRKQKKQKANWKKSIHFDILIYRTGFRADDEVGSQRKKEETIMESKKKTKVWSILYPKDSGDIARDEAVKQVSEQ